SVLAGRWVAAVGPLLPMALGCIVAGVGIILTEVVLTPTSTVGTLWYPLGLAGIGLGTVLVPVTSTALGVIPPDHSGMAASMTNTSRELGAVGGTVILGSIVNGQLTVDLVHRLTAIGIPTQFQQLVVAAIETGSVQSQTKHYAGVPQSVQQIINEVTGAAYGAFTNGLDISLSIAGSLMLACGFLIAFLLRRHAHAVATLESRQGTNVAANEDRGVGSAGGGDG
ncbi:MAG TPA: hypothetical protein VGS21_12145, partial [Acidimicrobiales bacterium]|nr:hypothetical protein [Acidimicrobiales bacterium]